MQLPSRRRAAPAPAPRYAPPKADAGSSGDAPLPGRTPAPAKRRLSNSGCGANPSPNRRSSPASEPKLLTPPPTRRRAWAAAKRRPPAGSGPRPTTSRPRLWHACAGKDCARPAALPPLARLRATPRLAYDVLRATHYLPLPTRRSYHALRAFLPGRENPELLLHTYALSIAASGTTCVPHAPNEPILLLPPLRTCSRAATYRYDVCFALFLRPKLWGAARKPGARRTPPPRAARSGCTAA